MIGLDLILRDSGHEIKQSLVSKTISMPKAQNHDNELAATFSSLTTRSNELEMDDDLLTPVLNTPKTVDYWLTRQQTFALDFSQGAPTDAEIGRQKALKDLPMDSDIGLRSPCDGLLAKRRKQMRELNKRPGSFCSDSNSCDLPIFENSPRDLTIGQKKHGSESNKSGGFGESSQSFTQRVFEPSSPRNLPAVLPPPLGERRYKDFKHPSDLQNLNPVRENDLLAHINRSPLAVPSPNWSAVEHYFGIEPIRTPKNLDNTVFDFLGVLPLTPRSGAKMKDRSPNPMLDSYSGRDQRLSPRLSPRYPIPEQPTDLSRRPPPPVGKNNEIQEINDVQDLSTKKFISDPMVSYPLQPTPQFSPPSKYHGRVENLQIIEHFHKREVNPSNKFDLGPKDQSHNNEVGFGHSSHHLMHHTSYQNPFYFSPHFHHGYHSGMYGHFQDLEYTTPPRIMCPPRPAIIDRLCCNQPDWNPIPSDPQQTLNQYQGLTPGVSGIGHSWNPHLRQETSPLTSAIPTRLPEIFPSEKDAIDNVKIIKKKYQKKTVPEKCDRKRGRGKIQNHLQNDFGSDSKRQYVCQYCQRSYDWNYNLNRHQKYECGKENAFQCAKCCRKFPHKQNCVYHLKRKHKIVYETIDQYMTAGLVYFRGSSNTAGHTEAISASQVKLTTFPETLNLKQK